MKVLLLFAACSLSACSASMVSSNPVSNWAYAKTQESMARGKAIGDQAKKEQLALIAKGAMDPWDRAETQIYREYMDAKYGPTPVKNTDTTVMDDIPESRN